MTAPPEVDVEFESMKARATELVRQVKDASVDNAVVLLLSHWLDVRRVEHAAVFRDIDHRLSTLEGRDASRGE